MYWYIPYVGKTAWYKGYKRARASQIGHLYVLEFENDN